MGSDMHKHRIGAAALRGAIPGNIVTAGWRGALAVLALGIATGSAQAGAVFSPLPAAYGSAIVIGNDGAGCPAISANCVLSFSDTSGVSASLSDSNKGVPSSASAVANLAAGYVSVSVSGLGDNPAASANAIAVIWNTLTFSGPSGTSANIVLNMTGTATLTDDASIGATAILYDPLSGGFSSPLPNYLLSGNGPELSEGVGGTALTPNYSLAEPYTVTFGTAYILGIAVQAHAGLSVCQGSGPTLICPPRGSASINDPITFTLPTGVTFKPAFVGAAVPEPASWTLLMAGLTGFLFVQRRRRVRARAV